MPLFHHRVPLRLTVRYFVLGVTLLIPIAWAIWSRRAQARQEKEDEARLWGDPQEGD